MVRDISNYVYIYIYIYNLSSLRFCFDRPYIYIYIYRQCVCVWPQTELVELNNGRPEPYRPILCANVTQEWCAT